MILQVMGAIEIHQNVAEMNTGESQDLDCTPLCLTGKTSMLVTGNNYLAERTTQVK